MAHLVLQDLDPRVVEALAARAERHGSSIEAEAGAVLEGALGLSRSRALAGARRLRAQWSGRLLAASDELLRAERQRLGGGGGEPSSGGGDGGGRGGGSGRGSGSGA